MKIITTIMASVCCGVCITAAPLSAQEQCSEPLSEGDEIVHSEEDEKALKPFLDMIRSYKQREREITRQLEQLPIPTISAEDEELVQGISAMGKPLMNNLKQLNMDKVMNGVAKGDEDAEFVLGVLYMMGYKVEQDFNKSLTLLTESAKKGCRRSVALLGTVYACYDLAPEYIRLGMLMLEHAAFDGEPSAMYQLSMIYFLGITGEQDLEAAQYWYERVMSLPEGNEFGQALNLLKQQFEAAAEAGNAEMQCMVGLFYYFGIYGAEEDNDKAIKWFRAAAEQDESDAQLMLGIIYEEGEIVPQDLKEAEKWLRKAAAQGNEEAQQALEALKAKQ